MGKKYPQEKGLSVNFPDNPKQINQVKIIPNRYNDDHDPANKE